VFSTTNDGRNSGRDVLLDGVFCRLGDGGRCSASDGTYIVVIVIGVVGS